MAFVAVRAAPGLRSAAPTKTGRSSRPAAGVLTITARCRPFFCQPPRAFYRNNGAWDDAAAESMRDMMKEMAKQWKETGNMSDRVFWPGGGVEFGPNRCKPSSSNTNNSQHQQGKAGTPVLPLDVADAPEGFYTLCADVPGLSKADLSIKLSKERVLTISGERKSPLADAPLQQQERVLGSFERRWQLPEDVESEGISAKVADGVLTITAPKKQPEPEPVDEQQDIFIV